MLSYMELYDILEEANLGTLEANGGLGGYRTYFVSEHLVIGEGLNPSPTYFLYPKTQEIADKLKELFKDYPEVKVSTPTDGIYAC